jgi:hypothetical protein
VGEDTRCATARVTRSVRSARSLFTEVLGETV